jgi:hypothetical protein
MNKQPDRNKDYMYKMWGTDRLSTDYNAIESLEVPPKQIEGSHFSHGVSPYKERMLREIVEDDLVPKKHNFEVQNEIHEKIRNDEDYDDWGYGTEPIPLREWR